MSLETPIKIRMLQRKLYQKAKEEPSYRFYLLYDKMYREDVLAHAYALVKSNQGAPGVDGQSFWGIESQGLEEWLRGIREDLRAKTYQPRAVVDADLSKYFDTIPHSELMQCVARRIVDRDHVLPQNVVVMLLPSVLERPDYILDEGRFYERGPLRGQPPFG